LGKALAKRKADGFTAVKTIPLNAIIDPEASAGIGKGTFGFAVFSAKCWIKITFEVSEGFCNQGVWKGGDQHTR
jgi:hypothetical protein